MNFNELDSLMMQADIANQEARERGSMIKHTPGPWKAFYKREGDPAHVEDANGELVAIVTRWGGEDTHLIAAAPELDAYRQYIEDNLERIERGGWTPVCFDEFRESEGCANYMKEEP